MSTTLTETTVETERVHAGMALLERELGPTWADGIDLRALDLEDACGCVLGQTYGGFREGALALWGASDDNYTLAIDHGFYAHGMETDGVESEPGARANYVRLTDEWRRQLTPKVRRLQPDRREGNHHALAAQPEPSPITDAHLTVDDERLDDHVLIDVPGHVVGDGDVVAALPGPLVRELEGKRPGRVVDLTHARSLPR